LLDSRTIFIYLYFEITDNSNNANVRSIFWSALSHLFETERHCLVLAKVCIRTPHNYFSVLKFLSFTFKTKNHRKISTKTWRCRNRLLFHHDDKSSQVALQWVKIKRL
jgi:hypothetical protein